MAVGIFDGNNGWVVQALVIIWCCNSNVLINNMLHVQCATRVVNDLILATCFI